MQLQDFNFTLPAELIAQEPADPRDSARLLDVSLEGVYDRKIGDLPQIFGEGDLLVFNDTRVLPAQLNGKRGEARIALTLHKRKSEEAWWAFAKPAKKCHPGEKIYFDAEFWAEIVERNGPEVLLVFNRQGPELMAMIENKGAMPLPPYIKRDTPKEQDKASYQTIFADKLGAVAAPTAGLHFTPNLLAALRARGVLMAPVTLHVGAGTFLPVKCENIDAHKMHSEYCVLPQETKQRIQTVRKNGGRIIALGTTVLRTLEACAGRAGAMETNIFIRPGYRFSTVDMLLTNFHLPCSTLFMLVAAFSGLERMQAAYAYAIAQRYRFFSYGDACLLRCVKEDI